MKRQSAGEKPVYKRVGEEVARIPCGRVATYGQIARSVTGCTARMVGYAMAALPEDTPLPWWRVINARGEVSERKSGDGEIIQRKLLEMEGVVFDGRGRVDFTLFGWDGE